MQGLLIIYLFISLFSFSTLTYASKKAPDSESTDRVSAEGFDSNDVSENN